MIVENTSRLCLIISLLLLSFNTLQSVEEHGDGHDSREGPHIVPVEGVKERLRFHCDLSVYQLRVEVEAQSVLLVEGLRRLIGLGDLQLELGQDHGALAN